MSTDALFSALGGGGLATVLIALIAWARSKPADQVSVADKWEAVTNSAIDRAERQAEKAEKQAKQWEQTADRVTAKLDACEAKVVELEQHLVEARQLGRDMAGDLDRRGADTTDYRRRLRAI